MGNDTSGTEAVKAGSSASSAAGYQLEESEVLSEPTPTRDDRRAILSLEASEGGAGVLSRLISQRGAFARVAREALALMHYASIDEAVRTGDLADLKPIDEAVRVKGCYRCLLSYFNQPYHELIDRMDPEVLRVPLRLTRSEVRPLEKAGGGDGKWTAAFARWKFRAP